MCKWAIHFTARGRRPHYCWESAAASTTTGGTPAPVPGAGTRRGFNGSTPFCVFLRKSPVGRAKLWRTLLEVADVAMTGGDEVRLSTRVTFRDGLVWAMGLFLVAYVGGLALPGDAANAVVNLWLGLLTVWMPAAVCWLAVWRVGSRGWGAPLLAAAATSFAAGNTYYVLAASATGSLSF